MKDSDVCGQVTSMVALACPRSWGTHLRVLEEAVLMFGDPKQRRQEHGAGVQAQLCRALHHVGAAGPAVLPQLVVPRAEDGHRRVDLRGGRQLQGWQARQPRWQRQCGQCDQRRQQQLPGQRRPCLATAARSTMAVLPLILPLLLCTGMRLLLLLLLLPVCAVLA